MTGLHSIHTPAELEELGQAAGMEIETFADWEKACEKRIGAFVSLGIVAFKELHLYFRPPEIDVSDFARAAVEFAALRRGGSAAKNLQDAMLFRVYELLAGTGLPVQVHTGATLGGAKSAGYLWEYKCLMVSKSVSRGKGELRACVARIHKKLLTRAGIEEHVRFHDLRRTFATMALQNGVDPKTVSRMLGHCSAEFTLDVYTNLTRDMQREAAQKIGGFMAAVV